LVDKHLDAVVEIRLHAFLFGELALHVGGKPDASQRPRLGKKSVRIKHDECNMCVGKSDGPRLGGGGKERLLLVGDGGLALL
jgi:hypothetical protein